MKNHGVNALQNAFKTDLNPIAQTTSAGLHFRNWTRVNGCP